MTRIIRGEESLSTDQKIAIYGALAESNAEFPGGEKASKLGVDNLMGIIGPLEVASAKAAANTISVTSNSLGQKLLQVPGLAVANASDDWFGWIGMMKAMDEEIRDMAEKDIFDSAPAMVNIPISEEFAGEVFEIYHSAATGVKARLNELILTHRIGNITVNLFKDNAEGRQELEEIIKASGITKNQERIITFAYQKDDAARDSALEGLSYVVYMAGELGKTATPIGTCGMAGLEYLNRSDLLGREKRDMEKINQSTERFVHGLAVMAGTDSYEAILDEIAKKDETGIRQLLATGLILVRIRPVDTQEIIKLHERDAEVLKSL